LFCGFLGGLARLNDDWPWIGAAATGAGSEACNAVWQMMMWAGQRINNLVSQSAPDINWAWLNQQTMVGINPTMQSDGLAGENQYLIDPACELVSGLIDSADNVISGLGLPGLG
jgi:hypothetical protein